MVDQSTDEAEPGPIIGPVADPDIRPDHDIRAVLAITSFRRLWLALGLSSFGDWLGLLAITALAGTLPQTPAARLLAVSGVFILRLAPAVLFGPLAGVVADRLPRRWILVFGDVLRFVLFCSIPLVGTLWWLFVATVLVEVVGLFWMPAKDATVPGLVPRRRLEAANQLSLVVTYGSAPVAALAFAGLTLLNGMLDGVVHPLAASPTYLALYVNAVTFAVSAAVIWRLELPVAHGTGERQESFWRTAADGWRFVSGTPLVRALVLGMLGAFAAGGVVMGLARSFVSDVGAGDPGYGTLFAAVFIGMAAGMWLAPRLLAEFSRRRMFGLSIASAGFWLVLLSLVPNIVLAVFFTAGLGACAGAAWVTGYTLLGLEVGDEVRGRTFALVQSMVRVVLVAVLAVAPVLAAGFSAGLGLPDTVHLNKFVSLTYTGVMATFLIAGVLALAIGVVAYRQMDDRPGVPLLVDLREAVRAGSVPDVRPGRTLPGRFIAFEGGDGAGKSTQAALLGTWLDAQGYRAVLTREPGATSVGQQLRQVLLHGGDLTSRAEALLFAADRAHHVETVVRPALIGGSVVVTDRYLDSSIAYQGSGRDLGGDEVAQLSRWATQGLVPDLTVLLDIEPDDALGRLKGEPDRLESETTDFHGRVREQFLALARRAPSRYLVLDGALGPQDLHAQIVGHLGAVLPESPVARDRRLAQVAAERAEREAREAAERAERLATEAAERQARVVREAAERAEREARQVREAAERAEREARQAAERAEREVQEAERRRVREQAAAQLAARRATEQQARMARAEAEVAARAERDRQRAQRPAPSEAPTRAIPAVPTQSLPAVASPPPGAGTPVPPTASLPTQPNDQPRTAKPVRAKPAEGKPAEGKPAGSKPAGSKPPRPPRPARSTGDESLDKEIFGLGERDET